MIVRRKQKQRKQGTGENKYYSAIADFLDISKRQNGKFHVINWNM